MNGILLDTHAFVWAACGESHRFSSQIQRQIQAAMSDDRLYLPAISLWEVAMLVAKGRLGLGMAAEQWMDRALRLSGVRVLALDTATAGLSVRLMMHGDPADRLIVAAAMTHSLQLCTQDGKILSYAEEHPELRVLPLS